MPPLPYLYTQNELIQAYSIFTHVKINKDASNELIGYCVQNYKQCERWTCSQRLKSPLFSFFRSNHRDIQIFVKHFSLSSRWFGTMKCVAEKGKFSRFSFLRFIHVTSVNIFQLIDFKTIRAFRLQAFQYIFPVCFPPSRNSTINPILYNVMSHRYRIAFRETLCSRKRGFYSSTNGFVRDQSSFRETTIAAAGRDHNLNYEGSQLVNIVAKSWEKGFVTVDRSFLFQSSERNPRCHHTEALYGTKTTEDWITACDGERKTTSSVWTQRR